MAGATRMTGDGKKGEEEQFEFFLKDREVFANPIPGVYIDVADFPKELK